VRGGGGYNRGSFVYWVKGCGGGVFAGVMKWFVWMWSRPMLFAPFTKKRTHNLGPICLPKMICWEVWVCGRREYSIFLFLFLMSFRTFLHMTPNILFYRTTEINPETWENFYCNFLCRFSSTNHSYPFNFLAKNSRQRWLRLVPGKGSAVQKNSGKEKSYLSPTPNQPNFFLWFWIHTASAPSKEGTHTDGGAVIR